MIENYLMHLAIIILINCILALSLQLSMGFSGLLNLGHIAFFALGAYTSTLLTGIGVPFLLALLLAGIVPAIFGYFLAQPIKKLKGDYLALATMGFSFVIYAVLINWTSVTRGPLGIPGIMVPNILSSIGAYLLYTLALAGITYLVIRKLTRSPFGKLLEAIRDDELSMRTLGKNTLKMKSLSLATAAFFAGIAGHLYAHYITYIDPSSFGVMQITPLLAIVIIGGLASLEGTIIATFIITLIPEALRFVGFSSTVVGPLRQILFALLLLLIIIYLPKGLKGKVELET